jgi:hypothetical protein
MVNVNRVKAKLPSLLCDRSTTNPEEWAKRRRIENGLKRLRRRNSAKYKCLETRLVRDLEALEKAISER